MILLLLAPFLHLFVGKKNRSRGWRGHHPSLSPGHHWVRESLTLTPADADEHPLVELVCRVGEHDGRVQVTTLAEHPEKVGDVEVIVGSSDQAAPNLPGDVESVELCVSEANNARSSREPRRAIKPVFLIHMGCLPATSQPYLLPEVALVAIS